MAFPCLLVWNKRKNNPELRTVRVPWLNIQKAIKAKLIPKCVFLLWKTNYLTVTPPNKEYKIAFHLCEDQPKKNPCMILSIKGKKRHLTLKTIGWKLEKSKWKPEEESPSHYLDCWPSLLFCLKSYTVYKKSGKIWLLFKPFVLCIQNQNRIV